MGLDVIAFYPNSKIMPEYIAEDFRKLKLVRGAVLYAPFAFRGNRYDELIKQVTGISHYDSLIFETKTIQSMLDKLKKAFTNDEIPKLPRKNYWPEPDLGLLTEWPMQITQQEKEHLVLFFHLSIKHGLHFNNYY